MPRRPVIVWTSHLLASCAAPVVIFTLLGSRLSFERSAVIGTVSQLWLLPVSCALAFLGKSHSLVRVLLIGCTWSIALGILAGFLASRMGVSGDAATGIIALFGAIIIVTAFVCLYCIVVAGVLAMSLRRGRTERRVQILQ